MFVSDQLKTGYLLVVQTQYSFILSSYIIFKMN